MNSRVKVAIEMNALPINVCAVDAALSRVVHIGVCRLVLGLRLLPYTKTPWLIHRGSCRYGGRIQIGNQLNLFSQCVPDGKPLIPDAPGMVRIYGGPAIRTSQLPIETTDAETIGLFRGHFTPDNTDVPGRYVAFISFTAIGSSRAEAVVFELAPGGHALGGVMSAFTMTRPDNLVVLAHTESGKITTGRGPYLDEGI